MNVRRGESRHRGRFGRRALLAIVLPLAMLGCSGASSTAPQAASFLPVAASGSGVASGSSANGACAGAAGDRWLDFQADGQMRKALLHVPAGAAGGRLPAIVALHGYGSKAADFASYSGLSGKADRAGFLVVYPQALGGTPEWQLDGIPSDHPEYRASDRSFIAGIVDWLAASSCVDGTRLFLAGHSQGGGMTADVACDLGPRVAGIGMVSALRLRPPCEQQPIPVVAFHALDDPVLPYNGGSVQGAPGSFPDQLPVVQTLAALAARNACAGEPTSTALADGTTQLDWRGCTAPTRFFRLQKGGHDWVSTTTDRLWDFFSALPSAG